MQLIYVYGTRSYGESHILSVALTCLLFRKKERVVYLDCRSTLQRPLVCLRNTLLFAFVGLSSYGYPKQIYECRNIEAPADFCEN
jgi:hypothetical protein